MKPKGRRLKASRLRKKRSRSISKKRNKHKSWGSNPSCDHLASVLEQGLAQKKSLLWHWKALKTRKGLTQPPPNLKNQFSLLNTVLDRKAKEGMRRCGNHGRFREVASSLNFGSQQANQQNSQPIQTTQPLIWNAYIPPYKNANLLKSLDTAFWTLMKPHLSQDVTSFPQFYQAFCKVGAGGMKFEPWRRWLLEIALVLAKDVSEVMKINRRVHVQRFVIEEAAVAYATYLRKSVREPYIEVREFNRKARINGIGQPRNLKYYLPIQVATGPRSCGDVSRWVPIQYGDDGNGGLGNMPFLPSPPTHTPVMQTQQVQRSRVPIALPT